MSRKHSNPNNNPLLSSSAGNSMSNNNMWETNSISDFGDDYINSSTLLDPISQLLSNSTNNNATGNSLLDRFRISSTQPSSQQQQQDISSSTIPPRSQPHSN